MSDPTTRPGDAPDALLARWRRDGRPEDLAALFDAVAPELFRVALHLSPDAAAAEDALQDTFVIVLERAHLWDPARPAMPWLVGILKNQALMARRRAKRSPDPDRAPGPAAPLDPAFEAAEAEERERLREVLKGLPEPYRGVALLRWRYGLDPAAIAEVQGVPPGTVRSWLSRATARIKVSMVTLPALLLAWRPERGLEGVRAAILRRAAARHLPAPEEVAASGGVVVRAFAGVPVGRAILAASVAVLTVGVVGWALLGGDEVGTEVAAQAPREPAAPPPAPKPADTPAPAAVPAVGDAAAAKPAEAPFDGVEVELLVRDAAGNPAQDAEVRAWRPVLTSRGGPVPVDYTGDPAFPGDVKAAPARTDRDGRAILRIGRDEVPPLHKGQGLCLHAARAPEAAIVELGVLPESGRVRKEVTLEAAGVFQGQVRRKTGETVADALVYLDRGTGNCLLVRTDDSGRYRTPLLPGSIFGRRPLFVRAPGSLETNPDLVERQHLDGPERNFIVSPVWTLSGRCVDAAGLPIEGLPVVADIERSLCRVTRRATVTAADGSFALEKLDAPWANLTIEGGERGLFAARTLMAAGEPGLEVGDVVLGGMKELEGVVLRPDGSPEAGALVLLVPFDLAGNTILARAATDAEGRFRFRVADTGGKVLPGSYEGVSNLFAVRVLTGIRPKELQQFVEDSAGKWNEPLVHRAQTEGFVRTGVGLRDSPLQIRLGAYRVRFRLLDALTGEPVTVKKFRIVLKPTAPGRTVTLSRAEWKAEDPPPHLNMRTSGTYATEIEIEGFLAEHPATVEVSAEQEATVEVRLRRRD